jgi:AraC-like DNA-binding protein
MAAEYFFGLERPLHALPDINQVRAANLQCWSNLVIQRGVDPDKLLKRHGILAELGGEESFIDAKAAADLLEDCALKLNDRLFGVHLAEAQEPDIFGCITALCRAAPSLREAISCLIEFIPLLHSPESLLELVEGKTITEFRWSTRSDLGLNDQANCHGLTIMLRLVRTLAGSGFAAEYLLVPRNLHRNLGRELGKALGCEVRNGGSQVGIALPSSALDLPVVSANGPLYELLLGYMQRLRIIARRDLLEIVSDFVYRELSFGDPSIRGCAESLGLSPRTLQLRLKSRGVSFSDILDQQRLKRAKSILRNTDMTIGEIADHLGYEERTSFGRAFKRWTGLSPQQYRQRGAAR